MPSIVSSPTSADIVAVEQPLHLAGARSGHAAVPALRQGTDVAVLHWKRGWPTGERRQPISFMANKHGIPADQIELTEARFTPDPVLVRAMDNTGAWTVNSPRLLEEKGSMNWVAFRYSDWGWDGYGDVTVVRRETFEENPDRVRRFPAAQTQGLIHLLENAKSHRTSLSSTGLMPNSPGNRPSGASSYRKPW